MSKIDYNYIHDKKCELIKYLEQCKVIVSEQMEEELLRILHAIAWNEYYHLKGPEGYKPSEGPVTGIIGTNVAELSCKPDWC
jgi:hypothetical protein